MSFSPQDESLGIYVSVPFCKAKCSFCNFASGVFAGQRIDSYLDREIDEMRQAREWADRLGACVPERVDTVYLGGGTPSLLEPAQIAKLFGALRALFNVEHRAEITVEAAPGQLAPETLDALLNAGVNRLSFGVQSFVDAECSAVGRLHTGAECVAELRRVAEAGFRRVGVDLIVGLPGQTLESWRRSIEQTIACGVEHVSVYMLEVDEDSRLGREFLAEGARYGASALPSDDAVAENYGLACGWLEAAGIAQYEISNFARRGGESRHNRRYWERRPYLGFGLDAHSMLPCGPGAVRWANADEMSGYLDGSRGPLQLGYSQEIELQGMGRNAGVLHFVQDDGEKQRRQSQDDGEKQRRQSRNDGERQRRQSGCDRAETPGGGAAGHWQRTVDRIDEAAALEETLFLGLRLVEGVSLGKLRLQFGGAAVAPVEDALGELIEAGLLNLNDDRLRLTARGRMVSNEVFSRLLLQPA